MEFEEKVDQIAQKVTELKKEVKTEEATKNAFIMPFIGSVLGYDVFNPSEVVPEFAADVGVKRGEKVDYALVIDNHVQVLIECKKVGASLSLENASQLYRYFACTKARVGILTNGQIWNFYMDLDKPNRMDSKPFLTLDLLDIDRNVLPALQKLAKPSFDIDSIASSAEELKYVSAIKRIIAEEFRNPSNDMVRLLAGRVYDGVFRQNVMEKFTPLVEKAMKRYMADQVNERITSALNADDTKTVASEDEKTPEDTAQPEKNDLITTEEEIAGYRIVKAIGCSEVSPERITMRDAKSYCAIFLDDNNRRPIARLNFNTRNKSLTLFEDGEQQKPAPINALNDIYAYRESIRNEIRYLLGQ